MILDEPIVGKSVNIRTAEKRDASFVVNLRLNPNRNRHVKAIDPSVPRQEEWIEAKKRQPGDYHMIIETKRGEPLGTIAVYDIDDEKGSFDWGRWVMVENSPPNASIECALLMYNFAFGELSLECARFETRRGNRGLVSFHKSYEACIDHEDDTYIYYKFCRDQFPKMLKKYKNYHDIDLSRWSGTGNQV